MIAVGLLQDGRTDALPLLETTVRELRPFGFPDAQSEPLRRAIGGLRAMRTPWGWIAAGVILSTALIVAVSGRAWRTLWRLAGWRWYLVTGECQHQLDIVHNGDESASLTLRSRLNDGPRVNQAGLAFADGVWPPRSPEFHLLVSQLRGGENVRITVEDALFPRDWCHPIGADWSGGTEARIAGQICALAPDAGVESTNSLGSDKCRNDRNRGQRLVVAALGSCLSQFRS